MQEWYKNKKDISLTMKVAPMAFACTLYLFFAYFFKNWAAKSPRLMHFNADDSLAVMTFIVHRLVYTTHIST